MNATRVAALLRELADELEGGAAPLPVDAHRLGLELAAAVEAMAPAETKRTKRGRKAG